MSLKTWKNMPKIPHIASLILLALVVCVVHLTRKNGDVIRQVFLKEEQIGTGKKYDSNIPADQCNLFSGRWVYDNVSYPLYKEGNCSFMEDDFACEKYGRKDLKFQNWRWQPHHCDLPRFNGTALLEKLRGKKLVFVGDSLNRNQWRSMLCMIESYLPPSSKKSLSLSGNLYSLHSAEYNASIGFYWAPMLVESNCDDFSKHSSREHAIRIKSIENHGKHWIDADILIFDSYAWWRESSITLLWGSFGSPDAVNKTVGMSLRVYEIALNTWSDWLEMHINRTKTKLFFMSLSPFRLGDTMWGTDHGCYKRVDPIFDQTYWPNGANRSIMHAAESTIEKLAQRGIKVEYLNITQLSAYREDAHPSIYRKFWRSLSRWESTDTRTYADCIHWCLPGVPDVWNQIFYSYIMKS